MNETPFDRSRIRISPAVAAIWGTERFLCPGPSSEVQSAGVGVLQALALTEPMPVMAVLPPRTVDQQSGSRRNHLRLFLSFGGIGLAVFLAGLVLQVALVRIVGMSHLMSYGIQTAASIQLSYALNRLITWRGRNMAPSSLLRFNAQQIVMQGLGVAAYAGLIRLGMQYVLANVVVTGVLAPAGYASSHLWSMTERRTSWRGFGMRIHWPLFIVLALQVSLSIRLVWSNTAFTDEALYLWAGHIEWAHLLHGTPIPPFPTFFSGSPVVYPLIGALADSVGGLAAARLLSLAFMLGVTTLLWDTTSLLFGRRAAFFSAALFAVLGPTIRLGAFATYDAMALLLLVAAAWCIVRAADRQDATGWAAAAGFLLLAANLTKYATALFVPIVIALSFLATRLYRDRKIACMRVVTVSLCWISGVLGFWELATARNGYYVTGIETTTFDRPVSTTTVSVVIHDCWSWIGLLAVVAIFGAILAWFLCRQYASIITLLAGAALLVPLEQARIHTVTSLSKHVDFGAWFAAIAAGYAINWVVKRIRFSQVRVAATISCGTLILYSSQLGMMQAREFFGWPNAYEMIVALHTEMRGISGNVLIDSHSVAEYYLKPSGAEWKYWSSTSSLVLPSGHTISSPVGSYGNVSTYERFIQKGYFRLIELDTFDELGGSLTSFLKNDTSYVIVAAVYSGPNRFIIWKYEPVRGAR